MRRCAVLDSDLMAFQRTFAQLGTVCAKYPGEGAVPAYFRLLQRYEFVDVARAADAWAQSNTFFPQVADWLEAVRSTPKGEPLLELPREELAEWLDAERRGFEADVCSCRDCCNARIDGAMDDKPLRFVPTEDRFGTYEKRLMGAREVLRGHWAHGYELARWYQARANFYEVALRLKLGNPLQGDGAKSMETA